jgi:hypothetical protein
VKLSKRVANSDARIVISKAYRSAKREIPLERVGSELEKIVARSLRQAPPGEAPLMAWPVVCGSAVAERTRALNFEDGILSVGVPDVGWRSELQGLAPRYVAAINRYTLEMVRRIEFIVTRSEQELKHFG